ncbi:nitroreductase family protein [Erysipelotrichaceae bacterium RD49]|nr:nitroreductase family protein [Erysipelotrichaceae bacterium RD49]
MKFEKVLEGRRSIRQYKVAPVDHDVLKKLIKAASLAPSWKNSQCPRWYVITNDQMLQELKENALPPANQAKVEKAPCLIVACFEEKLSGIGNEPGVYANEAGEGWSYFDLGLAVENLCLEAYRQGLGTLIMGIRNEDVIRSVLKIPPAQKIVAVIAAGYPDADPKMPPRRKIKETTVFFD